MKMKDILSEVIRIGDEHFTIDEFLERVDEKLRSVYGADSPEYMKRKADALDQAIHLVNSKESNDDVIMNKSKLILNTNDGNTTYISPTGKTYVFKFNIHNNPYKLIAFLARNPNIQHSCNVLAEQLSKPRAGADFDPNRRVLDTKGEIKNSLKIIEKDFFIQTNGKHYSINCTVELS